MKKQNRGFISYILIFVIVVGIGAYYLYYQKNILQNNISDEVLVDTTESTVSTSSTEKVPEVDKNKVSTSSNVNIKNNQESIKNCGSVEYEHYGNYPGQRTSSEIKNLTCLAEKILTCSKSFLDIGSGKYTIYGKNNTNCSIGISSYEDKEEIRCDLPYSIISNVSDSDNKDSIADLPYMIEFSLGFNRESCKMNKI